MDDKEREEGIKQLQKVLAYDEAIGKLEEAGVAVEFLSAIEKNPELLESIKKIAPKFESRMMMEWSSCITVKNPHKPLPP